MAELIILNAYFFSQTCVVAFDLAGFSGEWITILIRSLFSPFPLASTADPTQMTCISSTSDSLRTIEKYTGEQVLHVSGAGDSPFRFYLYCLLFAMCMGYSFSWLFWLILSISLTLVQLGYALYQLCRISINLSIMSSLKFWHMVWRVLTFRSLRSSKATRRSNSLQRSR
jgi:hypothetical protein